jgi:hypothetical protein
MVTPPEKCTTCFYISHLPMLHYVGVLQFFERYKNNFDHSFPLDMKIIWNVLFALTSTIDMEIYAYYRYPKESTVNRDRR